VSDDALLLHDHFDNFSVGGLGTWTTTLDNLSPGFVDVYLYAPSNSAVSTGNMVVNGIAVEEIEGQEPGTLVEGVTFILTRARIIDGENCLTINGSEASSIMGISGHSGLQLLAIAEPPSPRMFLYNGFTTDNLLTFETHGVGYFYDMATDGGEIWIGVKNGRCIGRSTQGGAPNTFEKIKMPIPPGQSSSFQLVSIVYANDRFVCITNPTGYLDQPFSRTFYSTDGLVWTESGLNGLDDSRV
jgi:hypothetical protein